MAGRWRGCGMDKTDLVVVDDGDTVVCASQSTCSHVFLHPEACWGALGVGNRLPCKFVGHGCNGSRRTMWAVFAG